MKTIKIIDLLNKIANGEEVPKKIKFCFRTFEYNGIDDYLCIDKNDYSKEDYCNGYSIHKWIFGSNLNDEVEILEEEKQETKPITKKDFETLGYACGEIQKAFTNGWTKSLENKPLKDEKKIPEKLNYKYINSYGNISQHKKSEEPMIDKINEILDYLESEGE